MTRHTSIRRILGNDPWSFTMVGFIACWWLVVIIGNIGGPLSTRFGSEIEYGSTLNGAAIVFGVLFTTVLAWLCLKRIKTIKRIIATGHQVNGRITHVAFSQKKNFGSIGKKRSGRVRFEYEYDGENYRAESPVWKSRGCAFQNGNEVTLVVDPQNPSHVLIACLLTDDQHKSPGQLDDSFAKRPRYSKTGSVVGGVVCSIGQLGVFWLPGLWETSFAPSEQHVAFGVMASVPVAAMGFGIGSIAGMLAQPVKSAVLGATLCAVPIICCVGSIGATGGEVFLLWASLIFVGAFAGGLGGLVGQRDLEEQLQALGPALPARENAEELQAAKEAVKLKASEEAEQVDRCLSCGHVMGSHVTCPKCGWTYL